MRMLPTPQFRPVYEVGPRMVWLGKSVLDVIGLADYVEAHLPRPSGVSVARLVSKLGAVVGQDRVER